MRATSRFIVFCLSICLVATSAAATKQRGARQPIKRLTYNSSLPAFDLFDAIEAGTVETTVIARNSNEANLFVTNKTDLPVSVQVPKAVVAVQVLKQVFPQGGRNGNPFGAGMPGGSSGTGRAQPIGGGIQNSTGNLNGPGNNGVGNGFNGNAFGNGPGNGIFSVPSHATVQVPLKMVCLAHGKPDPRARMKYQLVKLEEYTTDRVLQETLELFATGDTETQSAQAAVWHLTDKISWQALREKQIEQLGGLDSLPYFSDKQVAVAESLIRNARENVVEKGIITPRREETAGR